MRNVSVGFGECDGHTLPGWLTSAHVYEAICRAKRYGLLMVEPGGNAGDLLIYRGAEKLVQAAGVSFCSASYESFMKDEVVAAHAIYVHGGGGIVPWWSGRVLREVLHAVRSSSPLVIVGPQTVTTDAHYVSSVLGDPLRSCRRRPLVFFARERTSLDVLKRCLPSWVELDVDHDTALNLEASDLGKQGRSSPFRLYALRTDKESVNSFGSPALSWSFDPGGVRTFDRWLALHAMAGSIVTNRLHSAIAGCVLQRRTILLPNSYHKNRSVWEFSLEGRCVRWANNPPLGPLRKAIEQIGPVRRALSRPGCQRLIQRAYRRLAMLRSGA